MSIVSFGKNATCAQRDSLRCSRPRVTFSFCLDLDDVMNINSQCMYEFHLSDLKKNVYFLFFISINAATRVHILYLLTIFCINCIVWDTFVW